MNCVTSGQSVIYLCFQVQEKYRSARVTSVDTTNHLLTTVKDETVKHKPRVTVGDTT